MAGPLKPPSVQAATRMLEAAVRDQERARRRVLQIEAMAVEANCALSLANESYEKAQLTLMAAAQAEADANHYEPDGYDGPCFHCSRPYSEPAGCLHCESKHARTGSGPGERR